MEGALDLSSDRILNEWMKETVAVCPALRHKTRDINIRCGNNVEIFDVKRGGA